MKKGSYGDPIIYHLLLPLAAFNISSLCLIFFSLITMCLGVFLLWLRIYGNSLGFLDMGAYFFSYVREVFDYQIRSDQSLSSVLLFATL